MKRTPLSAFSRPRPSGIIALSIDEHDSLFSVRLAAGSDHIFLATRAGMSIRFPATDVRPMGRTARGVRGITVGREDHVVEMETVAGEEGTILTVTEKGFGKRTTLPEYRPQGRGGKGLINLKVTRRNGPVVGVKRVVTHRIAGPGETRRYSAFGSQVYLNEDGEIVIETEGGAILARLPRPESEPDE